MWTVLSLAEQALYPSCWVEQQTGSWKCINVSTTPAQVTGAGGATGTEIPRGHAFMLRAKPGGYGGDASSAVVFKKAHLVGSNQTLLNLVQQKV